MSWIRQLLCILQLVSLVACSAAVQRVDGTSMRVSSEAFRAYAGEIFRLQNAVLSEVSFLLEAEFSGGQENSLDIINSLEKIESNVLDACASLNSIAVRRRDGGGVRPISDARASKAIPACERAALDAQEVIDQLRSSSLSE